jgi:hypothetical protein
MVACASAATGCTDTGVDDVVLALSVAGSAVERVEGRNGWSIELTQAELAFGPLYLCSSTQAGENCDTAQLEWVDSVVVDVLDPAPRRAGVLAGQTGTARSWMYDLGITSLLTQEEPLMLGAAQALGGNSVALRGAAIKEQLVLRFEVALPIRRERDEQGHVPERGVPVVRRSTNDAFEHTIASSEETLLVRFDASGWLGEVDFDALVGGGDCPAEGATVVCTGAVAKVCDGSGGVAEERDCAASGEVCANGIGCSESVPFAPEGQGARAVRTEIVSGARPDFEWSIHE